MQRKHTFQRVCAHCGRSINACMLKTEAIRLLGGSPTSAARLIGISASAVSLWPDELPPRIADRVQAALWRKQQGEIGAHPEEARDAA